MIISKSNSNGIDGQIKKIQTWLEKELVTTDDHLNSVNKWGATTEVDIYGRLEVKLNKAENEVLAWTDGKESPEVFPNDRKTATLGFRVMANDQTDGSYFLSNIDLICTANLNKVTGGTDRNDQQVMFDLMRALKRCIYIDTIGSDIKKGSAEVFSGLDQERVKHEDMHPNFIFAINLNIGYHA